MKKPKINSGDKGKRTERALCKILSDRFGRPFNRVVGSGNRWAQVSELTEAGKDILVGDVVCPDGFLWTVECKGGYDIDLHSLFTPKGHATLNGFLNQAQADAVRAGKRPLLFYKRDRSPWMAFVPSHWLYDGLVDGPRLDYWGWSAVSLRDLLELSDEFFFA